MLKPFHSASDRLGRAELERGGVLVVEDEPLTADDIMQAFEEAGVRVAGVAPSVEAALTLIAGTRRLDGAVLDVNLRGEMAFPVADELIRRGVPFLFATACDAAAIPERFAHVTLCEKPLDVNRIVPLLLMQLGQADWPQARTEPVQAGQGIGAG